jgi:hypothetical protein
LANTAFISIHHLHPGDLVPGAPGPDACCAMYSAVVLTPAGAIVTTPDGQRSLTDINFVQVTGTSTTASVQAAVLAAVQAEYGDGTIAAQYL